METSTLYADARKYWTLRGGDDYFREQEGQEARHFGQNGWPSGWQHYQPESILEVGCGYGRCYASLSARLEVPLTGIDFSPTQLQAGETLPATRDPKSRLILGGASDFRSPIDRLTWS